MHRRWFGVSPAIDTAARREEKHRVRLEAEAAVRMHDRVRGEAMIRRGWV